MAALSGAQRRLRLVRRAAIAVFVLGLVLLATAGRETPSPPAHPGVAAGGTQLTYRAEAAEPLPLLRSPVRPPRLAGALDLGGRLLAADWQVDPPTPGGLGPHLDQASCLACHLEGLSRADAERRRPPPVARLMHPHDVARYGGQVNIRAVPGSAPQGRVVVRWETSPLRLADGTEVRLRRPHVAVVRADGGDRPQLAGPVALRMPPALFGWGLLEAVPDAFLYNVADPDDTNRDGISGRVSVVEDRQLNRLAVGRFGWKAEQPTLRQQTAAALCNDMGITSSLFPARDCVGNQGATGPELSDARLDLLVQSQRYLGVPDRRRRGAPDTDHGRSVFERLGCHACHLQVMTTGPATADALADQVIWPYSDLLLHDMGEGLADPSLGPDDRMAREWRTAPLWGIGLMAERFPERGFLHDGRARTILEAILWHGGEAGPAREQALRLDRHERAALLAFLRSL
jgi:CxxC motif-containing protein (DUF1111 family)